MKITKARLKQIIVEELEAVIEGQSDLPDHGVKTYISPRQKAYNEKMKRLAAIVQAKEDAGARAARADELPRARSRAFSRSSSFTRCSSARSRSVAAVSIPLLTYSKTTRFARAFGQWFR